MLLQSYTGGIGAYIEQVEAIMGSTSPIILYCGTKTFDYSLYKSGNVVDISKVSNVKKFNQLNVSQQSQTVYQATLELLFHYDQVTNIEYQDFRGVSAGIAQAKLAGELPPTVHLIVRCHASVSSIVFATHQQLNTAGLEVAKLEKLSVQYADIVLFPTQYLHDMYSQLGYSLVKPKKEVAIRRLPYQYTTQPGVKYSTITNIAFLVG
ncbi:MAG: hypothetical protein LC101_05260 [Flavobacteriales bacterium]|nr:hypothetical protein [Flavobacteriales bacterium]